MEWNEPPGEEGGPQQALIGRVIAEKFRLRRCIGVGGSGAVFQADQLSLGRTVAVKVLHDELTAKTRTVQRFHDEALAASRLNHPNTVAVIDYGQTDDGLLYLVMEYLRGPTLTDLLRAAQMPARRISDIVSQVLSGLEEAHGNGVVHADLKSDNIIVEQRRDDWDLVKVLDFGIARLVNQQIIADETICGTPEYMAPEVIRGGEPTFASDIYSVGVVLYELLTGSAPFESSDPMEILNRHLRETPVPPAELVPDRDVSPELAALAMRALSKEPGERFASATEFRDELASLARAPRADSGPELTCAGCGATHLARFKFCPECGRDATVPTGGRPRRRTASPPLAPELPLFEREAELAAAIAFLDDRDKSGVLHLVGPGGSGKSRLVRDCCESRGARLTVYMAEADPTGLCSPFFPMRSMVSAILDLNPICSHSDLENAAVGLGLGRRDLPGIAALFGHVASISELEPLSRGREIVAATLRALRVAAERREVALLFEDIDRYDHPSLELLARLIEEGQKTRVKILCTGESAGDARWAGQATRLELRPLSARACGQLAQYLAQIGHTGMPGADEVASLTGGLPAHIEQLARYLVEGGALADAPRSLPDLIAARTGFLPAATVRVAQSAAVLGLESGIDALREILGDSIDDAGIEEALARLSSRGMLAHDGYVVRFADALVREVIYAATPADVRRSLHAGTARALARRRAEPGLLGHHRELAGDLSAAADALAAGGDRAVAELDDRGACRLYRRALGCARTRMLADDDVEQRARFVSISIKLADALRAVGELGLARGVIDETGELCLDMPVLRAQLWRASAHVMALEGATDRALATIKDAIGLGIVGGQRETLCELYLDLATLCLRAGKNARAAQELSEGIDLVTAGEGASSQGGPENLWKLILRQAHLLAGGEQHDRAMELAEHARRHAGRVSSRVGTARTYAFLAEQIERAGDAHRAGQLRRVAVDTLRGLGDRRGTVELLLAACRTTQQLERIEVGTLAEARELADEVGYSETEALGNN